MISSTTRTAVRASRLAHRCVRRTYATPVEFTPGTRELDPQLNGYPELPFVSRQHLPPKGWWDMQNRRNFGDTMHEQDEMLSMWGPDIPPIGVTPRPALGMFALATLGFVGFGTFVYYNIPRAPAIKREYPYGGLVTELGGLEENKARAQSEEEAD